MIIHNGVVYKGINRKRDLKDGRPSWEVCWTTYEKGFKKGTYHWYGQHHDIESTLAAHALMLKELFGGDNDEKKSLLFGGAYQEIDAEKRKMELLITVNNGVYMTVNSLAWKPKNIRKVIKQAGFKWNNYTAMWWTKSNEIAIKMFDYLDDDAKKYCSSMINLIAERNKSLLNNNQTIKSGGKMETTNIVSDDHGYNRLAKRKILIGIKKSAYGAFLGTLTQLRESSTLTEEQKIEIKANALKERNDIISQVDVQLAQLGHVPKKSVVQKDISETFAKLKNNLAKLASEDSVSVSPFFLETEVQGSSNKKASSRSEKKAKKILTLAKVVRVKINGPLKKRLDRLRRNSVSFTYPTSRFSPKLGLISSVVERFTLELASEGIRANLVNGVIVFTKGEIKKQ